MFDLHLWLRYVKRLRQFESNPTYFIDLPKICSRFCNTNAFNGLTSFFLSKAMMQFRTLLATSGIIAWSFAQSTTVDTGPATVTPFTSTSASSVSVATGTNEPCAGIASKQQEASGDTSATVPAELAYQCLQSVPIDKDGDSQLIDEIKLFLQWNTDTSYFKNLPDWVSHPVEPYSKAF